MKTQEIVKHITELENYPSYDGRYKIKYALSSTLPDTAFMKFIEDEGQQKTISTTIKYKIIVMVYKLCK